MADPYYVSISALQHWLVCPRQCCLIHQEQQWIENKYTAHGRELHKNVDQSGISMRQELHSVRALNLYSEQYGLQGRADLVEFPGKNGEEGQYVPFPVEHKRGKPKQHRADEVQLCAQALCLEEMFAVEVREGALFYHQPRRRETIIFDAELRHLTCNIIEQCREALLSWKMPAPVYIASRCDACSLETLCLSRQFEQKVDINQWLQDQINSPIIPE